MKYKFIPVEIEPDQRIDGNNAYRKAQLASKLSKKKSLADAVLEKKDVIYKVLDSIQRLGSMGKKEIQKMTGWKGSTYSRRIEYILETFDDEVYYNFKTHRIHSLKIRSSSL